MQGASRLPSTKSRTQQPGRGVQRIGSGSGCRFTTGGRTVPSDHTQDSAPPADAPASRRCSPSPSRSRTRPARGAMARFTSTQCCSCSARHTGRRRSWPRRCRRRRHVVNCRNRQLTYLTWIRARTRTTSATCRGGWRPPATDHVRSTSRKHVPTPAPSARRVSFRSARKCPTEADVGFKVIFHYRARVGICISWPNCF
jgi:hypothetical protein